MTTVDALLGMLAGVLVASVLAAVLLWVWRRGAAERLERHRAQLEAEAQQRVSERIERAELDLEKQRLSTERDLGERRLKLESKEDEVMNALLNAEKERDRQEQRRKTFDERLAALEDKELETRSLGAEYRQRLQTLAGLDAPQAREALLREAEREYEDELRQRRQELLGRIDREVQDEARKVLMVAMQRLSARPHHDVTATIVRLPSEDMKGRIIGREGRNIKSFEARTGTTLLIDETPDSVLVSSFDPVRREVARFALEALLRDGRIHPSSIEEAVEQAEKEVQESVIHFGEEALRQLRLGRMHPEVIACIGRLHYRLSNNQNSLEHSIEVGHLCGLLAAELGLDTEIARRCGLLHDIGKVLHEDYEGSHAIAGANFLKRYGQEDAVVLNAVAGHHEEVPAESAYVPLLMMADSLSAMRPGARAESIDSYIQRVRNLERIAGDCAGVVDAYAIQAGREIRVVVAPEHVDDLQARNLARQIRRRIEEELQYPGVIKVTVIREQRVTEVAK